MSPRAAWRLESLGFPDVYDYVGGKLNWLAAGLPTEGEAADDPRAGGAARADAPVCALDETLGSVRERLEGSGFHTCVVVNAERVVLGILRPEHLDGPDDRRVADAMSPGPSTFRPHVSVVDLAGYLGDHDLAAAPITTGEGVLVGLLLREDAEEIAREVHERGHSG
jgi:CBS domain-containing protein